VLATPSFGEAGEKGTTNDISASLDGMMRLPSLQKYHDFQKEHLDLEVVHLCDHFAVVWKPSGVAAQVHCESKSTSRPPTCSAMVSVCCF
jgi:hypothetical protein